MVSLKKRSQGFTIVELLIVIVVIGILAAIVLTTYNGIQQKARNTKRQTDVAALQTQIEAFFQQNGYYPNLTDLNDTSASGFLATNFKSLDQGALIDPSNATQSKTLVNSATPSKQYGYVVTTSTGATCEGAVGSGADNACAKYTLYAMNEGSSPQTYYTKANLD